ncbi:MAG: hypothetical protein C5B58_00980 [Acidobacteria bacterium]|nr:MAG: hypothetical protein C5B58_00980 [Acidobacteriota bacterium]
MLLWVSLCSLTPPLSSLFLIAQITISLPKALPGEHYLIVSFGKQAEFINQYVRKGSLLLVRGRLQTRSWADTKNPEFKHYCTEIIADTVELGPKLSKPEEPAVSLTPETEPTPDDIPF